MGWSQFEFSNNMFPIIIHSLFLQISSVLQSALSKTDTFATGTIKVFLLERCPSYRESTECKERQGPNLGVHFTEVSVL